MHRKTFKFIDALSEPYPFQFPNPPETQNTANLHLLSFISPIAALQQGYSSTTLASSLSSGMPSSVNVSEISNFFSQLSIERRDSGQPFYSGADLAQKLIDSFRDSNGDFEPDCILLDHVNPLFDAHPPTSLQFEFAQTLKAYTKKQTVSKPPASLLFLRTIPFPMKSPFVSLIISIISRGPAS